MSRDHRAFAAELHADAVTLEGLAAALDERAAGEDRETFASELRRDTETLRDLAVRLRVRARAEERFGRLLEEPDPAVAREAERARAIRASLAATRYVDDNPGFRGPRYTGSSHAPQASFV